MHNFIPPTNLFLAIACRTSEEAICALAFRNIHKLKDGVHYFTESEQVYWTKDGALEIHSLVWEARKNGTL